MFRKFMDDETGLELVEYSSVAALITLTIAGTIILHGGAIIGRLSAQDGMIPA